MYWLDPLLCFRPKSANFGTDSPTKKMLLVPAAPLQQILDWCVMVHASNSCINWLNPASFCRRFGDEWCRIEAGLRRDLQKISFRLCMPSCFFLLLLVSNINTADNLPSSGFIAWTRAFWSTLVTLWRHLFHLPSSFQIWDGLYLQGQQTLVRSRNYILLCVHFLWKRSHFFFGG